jgi:outer membrane protein
MESGRARTVEPIDSLDAAGGKGALDHYVPPRSEALASAALVPDSERVYDLIDLIDLAERANPDTRRAWEEARAAAARLGRTESRCLPVVGLAARGGWAQTVSPRTQGTEIVDTASLQPTVDLSWLLVDFGRRDADREHARQELLAASFAFNRRHQEVAFAVERSFYAFDASRAEVQASEAALQAADAVLQASEARRAAGFATQPEVLLAADRRVLRRQRVLRSIHLRPQRF